MFLFQEPTFLKDLLEPYTSLILGKYFNTGLLIIYGTLFALLLYVIPKRHKFNAILAGSILFALLSAPLGNFLIFMGIVTLLYLCSTYDFTFKTPLFWATVASMLISSMTLFHFTGFYSAFYAFAAYYTMFRSIHYFVDVRQGSIPKVSFIEYLRYILFFPTFSHGPIDRISTIQLQDLTMEHITFGFRRILQGIAKYMLLIYVFSPIEGVPFSFEQFWGWLIFTAYVNAISLYVLLSGDIDIVIGISSLLGFRVSENYPKVPYLQPNLTKFWQNWQATIVNWLTAYVYFPLCRNKQHMYLKTMFIIMIIGWLHLLYNFKDFPTPDLIVYYTLWGIFLGGALALSKLLERKKADMRHEFMAKHPFLGRILYADNAFTNALGVFITFNIIAIGWNSPLYLILAELS
jgi:membrane protein involved in D-alanine export